MVSMLKTKRALTASIIMAVIVFTLNIIMTPTAIAPKPGTSMPAKIEFMDYTVNLDLTVTFRYRVESGSNPAIKQWELYSDLFTDKSIISASEKFSVNPSKHRLRFIEHYGDEEVREVAFTLAMDYYSISIAEIPYTVHSPPYEDSGTIQGPGFPGDFHELASLYNIGTAVSLSAIVGLAVLSKIGLITITTV